MFVADAERDRKVADAVFDADVVLMAELVAVPLRAPVGDAEALRERNVTLAVAEAVSDVAVRVADAV